jgi:two-component system, NarL family, response regulator DegU
MLQSPIFALIADDQYLFRFGLIKILKEFNSIVVVGEVENGYEMIKKYLEKKPDVVLVDINMSELNGIETVIKIKEMGEPIKALFLTSHKSEDYIIDVINAGGYGLLEKSVTEEELFFAIRQVANGRLYFGKKISLKEINEIKKAASISNGIKNLPEVKLTNKEKEIFKLYGEGFNTSEIKEKLYICKNAVDFHRTNIMKKMGINSYTKFISSAAIFNVRNNNSTPIINNSIKEK